VAYPLRWCLKSPKGPGSLSSNATKAELHLFAVIQGDHTVTEAYDEVNSIGILKASTIFVWRIGSGFVKW
jgi:hypothetical protein